MAVQAGAAAAAAAAVAKKAFDYNRGNYQYDEGARRFARYTVGFNMAQAQTKMYREDIEDLTKLTVTKQDTYHTLGTIFFVLNFQLIMAGRLGVHGPSPPGWLLGLYWTNICSALMFLVTFTWMAMHASARATAGSAFMRTRDVRLPIPTPKQLDQARTTGNRFEKQRVAEVFRIPFMMKPQADKNPTPADPNENRRIPKWYQEDEVGELHDGESGANPQGNPEHFEQHRGLHEEWWAYDVYSRIGVFCFMSHWLSSASLYSMCHVFTELRCIWPAWTVTACFVASQYGIIKLDILYKDNSGLSCWEVEKVVPLVPFFAVAGMTIDYSVANPHRSLQLAVYGLAWCGYALQLAWALRLYELAKPRLQKEADEMPGRPWTPGEWQLPPAFEEAVYVVSAPKKTDAMQTCLNQELKLGRQGTAGQGKLAQPSVPSDHAWKLFRGACISTIAMWTLIICGRAFEQANGERMLLKQEGRVERWPSHIQPWMPPWSRFGTRNEWCHAGGCDRRLSKDDTADVAHMAHQLVNVLRPLVDTLERPSPTKNIGEHVASIPQAAEVAWPGDLHPSHLTAVNDMVAALAHDYRGALLKVPEPSTGDVVVVNPFELKGLDSLGKVSGGSLMETGLFITMDSGALAECAGLPEDGIWSCQQTGPVLPGFGASLKASVASRVGTGAYRAAITLEDGEDQGALLLLETSLDGSQWLPVGEVRMPVADDQVHLSLSPGADAVFVSMGGGEVLKWAFDSAEPIRQVPAVPGDLSNKWHAACPLGDKHMVHLATQPTVAEPKMYVRAVGE